MMEKSIGAFLFLPLKGETLVNAGLKDEFFVSFSQEY
jgi:hypothetical protein